MRLKSVKQTMPYTVFRQRNWVRRSHALESIYRAVKSKSSDERRNCFADLEKNCDFQRTSQKTICQRMRLNGSIINDSTGGEPNQFSVQHLVLCALVN